MFINNAWYVAGWSDDFDRTLKPLTLLDKNIVFYRQSDGQAVALEDACPHRKLPLSMGQLCGDAVECGYHGLTFDRTGSCVAAPTQVDDIPRRAVVHSYPVEDRWGLLWIWMGDPELADPDDIYTIENYDDATWGKTQGGTMDVACHYLYITDNLLDPYHVAWVHVSSFAGAGTEAQLPELDIYDDGVLVWRWMYDQAPPPYYADLVAFSGNCDRKQHYECRLPALAINKSVFTPHSEGGPDKPLHPKSFVNVSYNFMTPIDENNTRYFWFQHRNTDPNNEEVSKSMFAGATMAFEEDRVVLEKVHKGMAEAEQRSITLHLDVPAARFRSLIKKRIDGEQEKDQS